ncbi:MAG: membrane-bound lytic murein transglycosylase MltF [Gammaproteobacteria bacterium]
MQNYSVPQYLYFLIIASAVLLSACEQPRTQLDKIMERGVVRVVTRIGPSTYYIDSDGETGIEYEMARLFANDLGLDLEIIIARNTSEIVESLKLGQADIAAAGLSRFFLEDEKLVYGPGYQWVTPQVVYRSGRKRPDSLADIYPDQLHISDGTLSTDKLESLKLEYPNLSWYVHKDRGDAELLDMVESGEIAYTVVNSNELQQTRLFNPEVRAAFNLSNPRPLAWAMRDTGEDTSLLRAVQNFHDRISRNGDLAELIEYFYGYAEYFDYVDSRKFVDRFHKRLPQYLPLFKRAAAEHGFDWRFLAAVSYQESHWNPRARSPTGVRGMMMLTLTTARRVGIKNRLDPEQSIMGGAKYLKELTERIPDRIEEPDRTWMALAAYNVGMGHLEDARILTEVRGGNPDKWEDVKSSLPLLSRKEWYKQTRFGYARGIEPVRFVEHIRKYYKILIQLTQPEIEPRNRDLQPVIIDARAL